MNLKKYGLILLMATSVLLKADGGNIRFWGGTTQDTNSVGNARFIVFTAALFGAIALKQALDSKQVFSGNVPVLDMKETIKSNAIVTTDVESNAFASKVLFIGVPTIFGVYCKLKSCNNDVINSVFEGVGFMMTCVGLSSFFNPQQAAK